MTHPRCSLARQGEASLLPGANCPSRTNEVRFEARWKLGSLLAKVERGAGEPKSSRAGTIGFRAYLREIGLGKNRALEAQRISALPPKELDKALVPVVSMRLGPGHIPVVSARDNGLSRLPR